MIPFNQNGGEFATLDDAWAELRLHGAVLVLLRKFRGSGWKIQARTVKA